MEAFNFCLASEDHNLYTMDMRRLDRALMVHEDHVAACLDVDYAPDGQSLASAAYDRSVRLWDARGARSRDVYHTRRMQRIFCVRVTGDAKYVATGSDDTNVRLWRAKANDRAGTLLPREAAKSQYSEALVARHKHLPELKRLARHQHVPRAILSAKRRKEVMRKSEQRKEANRRKHGDGSSGKKPAREARIWQVE